MLKIKDIKNLILIVSAALLLNGCSQIGEMGRSFVSGREAAADGADSSSYVSSSENERDDTDPGTAGRGYADDNAIPQSEVNGANGTVGNDLSVTSDDGTDAKANDDSQGLQGEDQSGDAMAGDGPTGYGQVGRGPEWDGTSSDDLSEDGQDDEGFMQDDSSADGLSSGSSVRSSAVADGQTSNRSARSSIAAEGQTDDDFVRDGSSVDGLTDDDFAWDSDVEEGLTNNRSTRVGSVGTGRSSIGTAGGGSLEHGQAGGGTAGDGSSEHGQAGGGTAEDSSIENGQAESSLTGNGIVANDLFGKIPVVTSKIDRKPTDEVISRMLNIYEDDYVSSVGPGVKHIDKSPLVKKDDSTEVGLSPGEYETLPAFESVLTANNVSEYIIDDTANSEAIGWKTDDAGSGNGSNGNGSGSGGESAGNGATAGNMVGGVTESGNASANGTGESGSGGTAPGESASGAAASSETKPVEHVVWNSCVIDGANIRLSGRMDGGLTPADLANGNDQYFYLLELAPYEDSISGKQMIGSAVKATDISFTIPLNEGAEDDRLYNRFVACIWDGSKYIEVSDPIYVTNPEAIAKIKTDFKAPLSKKGLLIELNQISDAFNLGVCNVIVNIPFDALIGEGIDYEYDGEVYHFNKSVVETYDKTLSTFSNKSMNVHAILLNSFNPAVPELFYPGAAEKDGVLYHAFNCSTKEGYKYTKAIASFLVNRYSGTDPDRGLVQNWVIGNEINNQAWNYIRPMNINEYIREYERSFRVFYNAIKSGSANARVYFSLDNNWNQANDNKITYTAKDILTGLAKQISAGGNIDWGLAYHPYPLPMTEPEFWDDSNTGLVSWDYNSKVVNFANLAVLTDYMQEPYMLDTKGNVRHIILSEQGFTSESPTRGTVEELQAASFAYAYYIADSNKYIDAFILSRQIDSPVELKSSLAFGLWETNATEEINVAPSRKKFIWNVFRHIDKQQTTLENSEFAKEIIGIEKWSDVIPNFKWRRFEK